MLRWLLDLVIVMLRDYNSLTNTDGRLTIERTVLRLRVLKHTYLILVLLVRNGYHSVLKTIYGIGADGSKDAKVSGSTNKASNVSGVTNSNHVYNGNFNILDQYYRNTPLGDVFSLYSKYRIPQVDTSMQRIPKGKYWMTPDQMPLKRYNSDQIRQAISGAQNTRQWAQNVLNQNEINLGTIGDGNIYRDAYIHFKEPNNLIWQLRNKNPLAKVTYIPGIG